MLRWILVIVLATSVDGTASAQDAVRLDYRAPADVCSTRDHFEALVSGHLGYSPFQSTEAETIVVSVEANGPVEGRGPRNTLAGRIEFPVEVAEAVRTFEASDCNELLEAMALALAIRLEPNPAPPETRAPEPVTAVASVAAPDTPATAEIAETGEALNAEVRRRTPTRVSQRRLGIESGELFTELSIGVARTFGIQVSSLSLGVGFGLGEIVDVFITPLNLLLSPSTELIGIPAALQLRLYSSDQVDLAARVGTTIPINVDADLVGTIGFRWRMADAAYIELAVEAGYTFAEEPFTTLSSVTHTTVNLTDQLWFSLAAWGGVALGTPTVGSFGAGAQLGYSLLLGQTALVDAFVQFTFPSLVVFFEDQSLVRHEDWALTFGVRSTFEVADFGP